MENQKPKRIRTFLKEHKYEIILGTGLVITGIALVNSKNDLAKLTDIAMNSLQREERRIMFEIKELWDSIERLDPNIPINKFHKIPRRIARVGELEADLSMIRKEISKVRSK